MFCGRKIKVTKSLTLGARSITDIGEIKGLGELDKLKKLDLRNNQITRISGLENLIGLEKLCLRNNQITKIEGLENLVSLKELNLTKNQILKIEGLNNLTNLEVLLLRDNKISKIEGIERESHPKLRYLDLSNNPISSLDGPDLSLPLDMRRTPFFKNLKKLSEKDGLAFLMDLKRQSEDNDEGIDASSLIESIISPDRSLDDDQIRFLTLRGNEDCRLLLNKAAALIERARDAKNRGGLVYAMGLLEDTFKILKIALRKAMQDDVSLIPKIKENIEIVKNLLELGQRF